MSYVIAIWLAGMAVLSLREAYRFKDWWPAAFAVGYVALAVFQLWFLS